MIVRWNLKNLVNTENLEIRPLKKPIVLASQTMIKTNYNCSFYCILQEKNKKLLANRAFKSMHKHKDHITRISSSVFSFWYTKLTFEILIGCKITAQSSSTTTGSLNQIQEETND